MSVPCPAAASIAAVPGARPPATFPSPRGPILAVILLLARLAAASDDEDPFAGISPAPRLPEEPRALRCDDRFFSENFSFKKELMSEFGVDAHGAIASRQSVGFELLKKFSTGTRTVAAIDFQGRLVRRDGRVGFANDPDGANQPGWTFEYHNAWIDLYDPFALFLDSARRSASLGRFNLRLGHFYVPFGLNPDTDTHGTVLQLSNERNFGWDRDFGVGFWGNLSRHLRYDLYYLVGSGRLPSYQGQAGLAALRISLANRYASDQGLEAGLSVLGGQRLAEGPAGVARIDTVRAGVELRLRRPVPGGALAWTSELSAGIDAPTRIFTQLHQLDFLHASRRFGATAQFRWFLATGATASPASPPVDGSLLGELSWYFANDVAGASLHWIKLVGEAQLARRDGGTNLIGTLQYYRYW